MDRPVQEIGDLEVFNLHRRLGRESGQAYANAAMRVLSSVLNFGITKDRLATNPVAVLKKGEWFEVGSSPRRPSPTTSSRRLVPAPSMRSGATRRTRQGPCGGRLTSSSTLLYRPSPQRVLG